MQEHRNTDLRDVFEDDDKMSANYTAHQLQHTASATRGVQRRMAACHHSARRRSMSGRPFWRVMRGVATVDRKNERIPEFRG
jgi:hypothetical protein